MLAVGEHLSEFGDVEVGNPDRACSNWLELAPFPATPRSVRPSASGRCTGRRARPRAARGRSTSATWSLRAGLNLVVMNTCSRGTPLSRSPCPTLSSFAVGLGGVDVPVAELERPADCVDALASVRHLPDAEAEQRQLHRPPGCSLFDLLPRRPHYVPTDLRGAARAAAAMSAFVLACPPIPSRLGRLGQQHPGALAGSGRRRRPRRFP